MLIVHNDAIKLILTFNLILEIQGITIFILWAWPHEVGTTLKISYVILLFFCNVFYFYFSCNKTGPLSISYVYAHIILYVYIWIELSLSY